MNDETKKYKIVNELKVRHRPKSFLYTKPQNE